MSNGATITQPAAGWVADFCRDYTPFLFSVGKWTLIAGVLLGIALAVAMTVLLFRKKEAPADEIATANVATPTAVLDAVKGFLQALSSAPTWLALFGGGVLLLWLAGNAVPEICKPPPTCAQQCPPPVPVPAARAPGAQAPAGNAQAPTAGRNRQ